MRFFRDMSIRHKLTLMLLGVVSVILLAVSVANVIGELRTTRTSLVGKYSTLARIIAAQSGAALSIADIDPSTAQEIVSDLSAEPAITYAALLGPGDEVVVEYPPDSNTRIAGLPVEENDAYFGDGYLDVVHGVFLNDETLVGRVYIRASTAELTGQVQQTVFIAVGVYVLALLSAFLLSYVVQHWLSTPILRLADLTDRVSTEHDYSLSAEYDCHDELGDLFNGFNKMLAEIRQRDDELNRSNDELKQFAFVASHDLQEPLRSMTSFCNMLQMECQDELSSEAQDHLERIVGGAHRMKALVTDLLDYSRVSCQEDLELENVPMDDVVAEAIVNLQSSIDDSQATISCRKMPTVHGNRLQLVQVIQNLVSNSIMYRGAQPPHIQIEAVSRDSCWEFVIRDNGIGVATEHFERIFEIFKRLHNRNKFPGTGIGLAVCRKIVERHGGKIWIESEVGRGSVFRFTVPIRREKYNHEQQQLSGAGV